LFIGKRGKIGSKKAGKTMVDINYEINNYFFPFDYAIQHFQAIPEEATWEGRAVHLIVGVLELLFPISYIIAIFDRIIVTEQQRVRALQQPPPPPPPPGDEEQEELDLFRAVLLQLTQDLAFGLTGQNRKVDQHIATLKDRGIVSGKDLHALGLYELDQLSGEVAPTLFIPPNLDDSWGFQGDDNFEGILKTLEELKGRANPDRSAADYDRRAIEQVRTGLLEVQEQLAEQVEQALAAEGYAADYSLDPWRNFERRLNGVEMALGRPKATRVDELNELEEIAKAMQQEEPRRLQALNTSEQLQPHWEALKGNVAKVLAYVKALLEIEQEFQPGQYNDAEILLFNDMFGAHRLVRERLTKLSGELETFTAGQLPAQTETFREAVQTLEQHDRMSQVARLRLYVTQVNSTVAWRALTGAGYPNLSFYRQVQPDVTTLDLYHLAQTWG
jgi:hypothetical protein